MQDTLIRITVTTAYHLLKNKKTVYVLENGDFVRYSPDHHDDLVYHVGIFALSKDVHS